MKRTIMFAAGLCFAVTVAFLAAPARASANDIQAWTCAKPDGEGGYYECWCMFDHTEKRSRKICNMGGGCWDDSGWTPSAGGGDVMPDPNTLHAVSYNATGDMLIGVTPGFGGYYTGTANPHCWAFTSNTSAVVLIPATLIQ